MTYSESDRNQMFDFLRSKYQNPKDIDKIHEFQCRYDQVDPIQWYTKDWFLYSDLNKALREYDIVYLYGIRVFIKDLHQQIVRSHMKSKESTILKLYRGMNVSTAIFDKMKIKSGRLLSFNCFLSTTANNEVAMMYGGALGSFPQMTSVIFEINVDHSISTPAYYVDVKDKSQFKDEDEFLFTMGSVFRIQSIEPLNDGNISRIKLLLTDDNDVELTRLTSFIRSQKETPDELSFILLMAMWGKYEEAKKIGQLMIPTISQELKPILSITLAGIALEQGKREDTAVQLQSVCDFSDERSTISGNTIITSYREAMLCWMQGKWDLAVENLEAIYDIITSEDHPHLAPTYAHIGDLLKKEKKFSEALNHYGRALSILQRYLSSTNSALLEVSNIFVNTHLAYAYESISNLLYKQGDLCGTLEHLQHTMKARLQYLPPTDLAIAKLHTRLGDLQVSLQRNEEALSNFERALVIQAASLPADHLDIAETHTMIGRILLRQQKFREALKSYECALEILFESFASANLAKDETSIKSRNSFLVDIYALIGDVHCKTRNFSEAYQNYELALDIQLECTSAMDPTTHKIIKKLNCVHRLLVRLIT
ncbi:unnamed protein product [Rotaria sp. Silwood2]|nr:unnamed protein product [Rotaria sp. Silwood2]CAF2933448.1 unnamed protein product [Rotaria sp. Silwood2]CAF3193179.1 unnamed protein product [Rotaria sp. Silwood2]CAF3332209.1 unnamed protein product [Rotaria sp. Silwood2]